MPFLLALILFAQDKTLEAKISKVMGDLSQFRVALGAYEIDTGAFPTTEQGLIALRIQPEGAKGWKGPYLEGKGMLLDPWGNSYLYRSPGEIFPNGYDMFSAGPDGKPGTDDDVPNLKPKQSEGEALIKKVVADVRAQKSFETTFKARYTPPGGKALDYEGRQVCLPAGVLTIAMTGSGGYDKKIVRVGDSVWTYVPIIKNWDNAVASGDDGAAQGIQNPMEMLDLLSHQAMAAKRTKTGASITLTGDPLKSALKHHLQGNAVAWDKSKAQVDLTVDADGRLKTLSCNATLLSNNPAAPGLLQYSMDVSLVAFNGTAELPFMDERNRPIPLTAEMKEKVAALRDGKK